MITLEEKKALLQQALSDGGNISLGYQQCIAFDWWEGVEILVRKEKISHTDYPAVYNHFHDKVSDKQMYAVYSKSLDNIPLETALQYELFELFSSGYIADATTYEELVLSGYRADISGVDKAIAIAHAIAKKKDWRCVAKYAIYEESYYSIPEYKQYLKDSIENGIELNAFPEYVVSRAKITLDKNCYMVKCVHVEDVEKELATKYEFSYFPTEGFDGTSFPSMKLDFKLMMLHTDFAVKNDVKEIPFTKAEILEMEKQGLFEINGDRDLFYSHCKQK